MADAALYEVITDNVITLSRDAGGDKDFETTFDLPSTLQVSARSVLMIAVRTFQNSQNVNLDVWINGEGPLLDSYSTFPTSDQFTFQEVVPANLLKKGQNRIRMELVGGSGSARISDVVLLYGVNL
jgi:hypothetical protein